VVGLRPDWEGLPFGVATRLEAGYAGNRIVVQIDYPPHKDTRTKVYMSSNARKSAFLGMTYGAAAHRLRKQILFRYVQAAGDDFCFKCGARIETVEELSIEHKLPWEGRDVALFWDLQNIAFSHLSCNTPHIHRAPATGRTAKIYPPNGMLWCSRHKDFLPTSQFYTNTGSCTGYQTYCKECKLKIENKRRKRIHTESLPLVSVSGPENQ
jgi:hypothetical protein